MNPRNRRFLQRVGGAALVVSLVAAPTWFAGYRINETESLPPGLWRITGRAGTAERGRIVHFCAPDSAVIREARERDYLRDGTCPGGHEPLFKPVVAVAGDVVSIGAEGIAVNGTLLPNSAPLARDGVGRLMPAIAPGEYRVASGEAWLVSSYTPWSFDSRYFGPLPVLAIHGEAVPIWTFGESHVSH